MGVIMVPAATTHPRARAEAPANPLMAPLSSAPVLPPKIGGLNVILCGLESTSRRDSDASVGSHVAQYLTARNSRVDERLARAHDVLELARASPNTKPMRCSFQARRSCATMRRTRLRSPTKVGIPSAAADRYAPSNETSSRSVPHSQRNSTSDDSSRSAPHSQRYSSTSDESSLTPSHRNSMSDDAQAGAASLQHSSIAEEPISPISSREAELERKKSIRLSTRL